MSKIRTYSELILLPTFYERFQYLKLDGKIGEELFGYARYLNQVFYQSLRWKTARRQVIIRDCGNDLALDGYTIYGTIHVHHLNPLTLEQIRNDDPCLCDLENLVCTSHNTHEAITWGDESLLVTDPVIRKPNDTCPWKE